MKTKLLEIQTINKGIDKTNRIVLGKAVVNNIWKEE